MKKRSTSCKDCGLIKEGNESQFVKKYKRLSSGETKIYLRNVCKQYIPHTTASYCYTCKLPKQGNEEKFSKLKRSTDGLAAVCKQCNKKACDQHRKDNPRYYRNYHLTKTYGITLDEYEKLSQFQNNCCFICNNQEETLHVDHNHTTGEIRGLLCQRCNLVLGQIEDNCKILKRAIEYLEK